MRSKFSEFTYGFAVVSELATALQCKVAPIFPSLIEEGQAGGGYDVELDAAGIPIYLQFKLSDYMRTHGAKEANHQTEPMAVPYYRFQITSAATSDQHAHLLGLAETFRSVYYTAPSFWTTRALNTFWGKAEVCENSVFIAPDAIGPFTDNSRHAVCFNPLQQANLTCKVYSDPQKVPLLTIKDLRAAIDQTLKVDEEPIRKKLSLWRSNLSTSKQRADRIIDEMEAERQRDQLGSIFATGTSLRLPAVFQSDLRDVSPDTAPPTTAIDPDLRRLIDLGTDAVSTFGAHMFVLQRS